MRLKFLSSLFLLLSILFTNVQCNAPRNNPLDPLNPEYNYGSIEGVVQSVGIPSVGISNVRVLWENTNIITETDASGRFRVSSIPIKDGNIIFSKNGYKPDTVLVNWGTTKRYFAQVYFNRVPVLDSISIYTVVVNQHVLQPSLTLVVKAGVLDPDRDIDSVFVMNEELNLRKSLIYSSADGIYQTTITAGELRKKTIEEAIGHDFSIIAKDRFQNEFNIGEDRVTRIIKNEVSGLYPSTDPAIMDTSQPIIFNWTNFDAGYEFRYLIEVYSWNFTGSQLVHSKPDMPEGSIQYTLLQNLPVGSYYWVIWVIDSYQNRSRSKPATFSIVSSNPP